MYCTGTCYEYMDYGVLLTNGTRILNLMYVYVYSTRKIIRVMTQTSRSREVGDVGRSVELVLDVNLRLRGPLDAESDLHLRARDIPRNRNEGITHEKATEAADQSHTYNTRISS